MSDYFGAGPKKTRRRGKARKSLELIEAARQIAEATQPITVRGICYKLFTMGLIDSMKKSQTDRVSRLLRDAREEGTIPWEHIVDESRELERDQSWRDPAAFVRTVRRAYRRDSWAQQPTRVECWSEKGTIRGVLAPVLHEYGVGFRVMHGYGSATALHEIAQDGPDGRELIALYVGDWDCSGLHMSEVDLPDRLARYGGDHVRVERVALLPKDLPGLPSFAASDKSRDPRYRWFVEHFGSRCWELDALDPNALRERVEQQIIAEIEPAAWARCAKAQAAEQESLRTVLDAWTAA